MLKIDASSEFTDEKVEVHFKQEEIIFSKTDLTGKSAILHIFEYKNGTFSFVETSEISNKQNAKEPTESFITDSSRFITEWSKISREIKSLSLVVELLPSPAAGVSEIRFSQKSRKF